MLNGVVLETRITVRRHIMLLTATSVQVPRAAGCQALTNATPSTSGDSHASRFNRKSKGKPLKTHARLSTAPAPANQPAHDAGTVTVPTMMTSATPSFSSAGSRATGLSRRP